MGRVEFERIGLVRMLVTLPAERAAVVVVLAVAALLLRVVGVLVVTASVLLVFEMGVTFRDGTVVRRVARTPFAGFACRTAGAVVVLIHAIDAAVISAAGSAGGAAWL